MPTAGCYRPKLFAVRTGEFCLGPRTRDRIDRDGSVSCASRRSPSPQRSASPPSTPLASAQIYDDLLILHEIEVACFADGAKQTAPEKQLTLFIAVNREPLATHRLFEPETLQGVSRLRVQRPDHTQAIEFGWLQEEAPTKGSLVGTPGSTFHSCPEISCLHQPAKTATKDLRSLTRAWALAS